MGGQAATFYVTDFNPEAVGVAFDRATDTYYISNDSDRRVWIIDPGPDGKPGTSDDDVTSFPTNGFGSRDPEGLAFGLGDLFIADGLGAEIYRIDPGSDGQFSGAGDDVISHFDVGSLGQPDPEGIDFEPSSGHLWVVSNDSDTALLEVTPNGSAIRTVDIGFAGLVAPGGLAVARRTDGGSGNSVFVADR